MTDTASESEKQYHLQISPRTLQELASLRLALHIWHQLSRGYCYFYSCSTPKLSSALNTFAHNVPNKIRKMIEISVATIFREIHWWYKCTSWSNLRKAKEIDLLFLCSRFRFIKFGGNGTIHLKDTVANFIDDDSISNTTKFEIACINCVEEKIDFYWPSVSGTLKIDCMRFEDNIMLYYWVCRKRGELNRILDCEFNNIENFMIRKCTYERNHLAIEYFLKLLNSHDQVIDVDLLYSDIIRRLIPSFDVPLQHYLLDKLVMNIFREYVRNCELEEYAVQCWIYIKDTITPQSYYDTISNFIFHWNYTEPEDLDLEYICMSKHLYLDSLLSEIWSLTPLHLKEYVLNDHFSDISNKLSAFNLKGQLLKNSGRSIEFLLAILTDADVHLRKKFWNEHWSQWFQNVPRSQFEQLMMLCLAKPEAIEDFKRALADSEVFHEHCARFICAKYYDELDEFLSGLYSDQDQILTIKKLSLTKTTEIFWEDIESLENYLKYIDIVFSNDTALGEYFKDGLISSDQVLSQLSTRIAGGGFSTVKRIISMFASSSKREEMKINFLEFFHQRITQGRLRSLSRPHWREFVRWCLNYDEQRLNDFMASLPIDDIFEAAFSVWLKFSKANTKYDFSDFENSRLNEFFKWYFESKDDMYANFKRTRFQYYEALQEAEVERIFGRDKKSIVDAMRTCLFEN